MKYRAVKEYCMDVFGEEYKTYGVVLSENGKEVRRISDISRSALQIKKFCFKCNCVRLSSVHIDDVIEDFLADIG